MQPVGIGIIGTGNISDAYLKAAAQFPVIRIVACADINMDAARAKAATYGIEAVTVDELLADPRIGIVLNLTTPQHHVPVGLKAIAAGKHVYSEKPLAVAFADGLRLVEAAAKAGLRVGCAPDTFLGGSHQTARKAVDAGAIGTPLAGTAFMMVPGHELWHPNPDFYYKAGGGPMFDMGPYYLTCLVNLLGPVRSVTGAAKASYDTRTIGSGPRAGESFAVEVPTHISALLQFHDGAAVTITTSFDVWKHAHGHIEIYGSAGSMLVPDPNRFDGAVQVSDRKGDWTEVPQTHLYGDGNYRILGLADMAEAILDNRPHRASHELSLHVLEIMEAILRSAESGSRIELTHPAGRPAPMRDDLPFGQL
ncbi:Gfo/Idh/MocA family oxidoreductase [Devosia sp.]|uniref:Gfo/Idh/MocA family protein n=1 Tax=Devosia sp. TaxID=1871048 RepID=UPI001ACD8538|nr:Gfo/Idh/MocA family oxidoreductase [Devosia sp.]MBN9308521.1 Gfo/Idh/MocA family oxidoreductase [Devosia sp.]